MYTTKDFITNVGRHPADDDLERANCRLAGKPEHRDCGICIHNKPVFCCHECFHECHRNKQFKRKKIDPMITCNANRNRVKWSRKLKMRVTSAGTTLNVYNAADARKHYPGIQRNKLSKKEMNKLGLTEHSPKEQLFVVV